MRAPTPMMVLVASLALAACDRDDSKADMPMAAEDRSMDGQDMPMMRGNEATQTANAEGTIKAIDQQVGTITIEHGPAEAVGWSAMTMAFKANDAFRQQVAVGDEIKFTFRLTKGGGEITSISRN